MAFGCIPRVSSDIARQGLVDAELKTLKILFRRLQSTLTTLGTELQLLQRLYYKNKNQHRGALFWRSVGELRRSMQKIEALKLQGSMITLRNTFYGSTDNGNLNPMKGPWTHFPPERYLASCTQQYELALKLLEKASDVCLRAYKSFHRSLQAAAFLQILLMFVSICSRTRSVALEVHQSVKYLHACVQRLKIALFSAQPVPTDGSPVAPSSNLPTDVMPVDAMSPLAIDQAVSWSTSSQDIGSTRKQAPQEIIQPNRAPTSVVIEQKLTRKEPTLEVKSKEVKEVKSASKPSKNSTAPKKKRKACKNEIDDIFGF